MMPLIELLFLILVHAITQFFPVSSFGHTLYLVNMRGLKVDVVSLSIWMYMGTAMAILVTYRGDFSKIFAEFLGILTDMVNNLYLFFHNRLVPNNKLSYTPVFVGTWRKITLHFVVATVITGIIGSLARNLVFLAINSSLIPGIFTLISGLFLLVVHVAGAGGKRGVRETGLETSLWLGICQGLSVFPGISRNAMTVSVGLLCGLGQRFCKKFTLILSVPAILGAFFFSCSGQLMSGAEGGPSGSYFFAALLTFIIGIFSVKKCLKLLEKIPLGAFAFYNFFFGFMMLLRHFI